VLLLGFGRGRPALLGLMFDGPQAAQVPSTRWPLLPSSGLLKYSSALESEQDVLRPYFHGAGFDVR